MDELEKPRARLGDRSLFPDLTARAYLNHAALSPPSSVVSAAVLRCLAASAERGLAGAIEQRLALEEVRALAARLLHAETGDVAFVQSTTAGVVAIARSLPFARGERVVLFEGEFPANVTPWQLVARDLELELAFVSLEPFARSSEEGLTALRGELERGARLVAVSAVQFQTGLRMPLRELAELCHAYGAELFVDAIQGLGAVPIDVRDAQVDYLVAGGHKFLMGLEGAGILYVREQAMRALRLGLSGWTNHEDAFRFLVAGAGHLRYDRPLVQRPSFVEQGALNVLGYAALGASLELILGLGVAQIHAHVNQYLDLLEPELVALGCTSARAPDLDRRSATLSVRLPRGVELAAVARAIHARGVAVSTPDGHLRFAPHWPNHPDEVPEVIAAVRAALAS